MKDHQPGRGSRRRRGLFAGIFRLIVFAVLVGVVVVGAALYAPAVVDDVPTPLIDDRFAAPDELPSPSGEPPAAGDRNPEIVHPDDPNGSGYETQVENVTSVPVEDFVHAEVNDRRADHGLDPIEWDGTVASVSRAHSHDMAEREYFSHTNPDGAGPHDRFSGVADYCRVYGENLALNRLDTPVEVPGSDDSAVYLTAEEVADALVEQWMHSPDHRDAIFDDRWDRGGVGVYITDGSAVYATHNFCTAW